MSGHTAGPWTYDSEACPTEFDPERIRYVIDANTIVVAQNVQTKADARLIAAAPELLAALAYVVRSAGERFDSPDRRLSIEQARAALAKVQS